MILILRGFTTSPNINMDDKNPIVQFFVSLLGGGFLGVAIASAVALFTFTLWVTALAIDEIAGTNMTRGITSLQQRVHEYRQARKETKRLRRSDDGSHQRDAPRGLSGSAEHERPTNFVSEKRLHGITTSMPATSAEL